MKILILGHKGMAGHVVFKYLREKKYDIVVADDLLEYKFDALKNLEELKNKIVTEKIDCIVNCIGLLVKKSENNPILAIKTNSLFPHKLAKICIELNVKLIHLSTDCYMDNNIYGRSKRAGEIDYGGNLTIRTSIIGPEIKDNGMGLFDWFINQKGEVKGYSSVKWDGITTLELAKFINWYLEKKDKLLGIKNLRHPDAISKYDLLISIKEVYGKKTIINKFDLIKEDKTEKNDFLEYRFPSYNNMLKELKVFMKN